MKHRIARGQAIAEIGADAVEQLKEAGLVVVRAEDAAEASKTLDEIRTSSYEWQPGDGLPGGPATH